MPVDSQISEPPVVGGEVLPVNFFEVFLFNFWWIFLLILPAVFYLFYTKKIIRHLPSPILRIIKFFHAN